MIRKILSYIKKQLLDENFFITKLFFLPLVNINNQKNYIKKLSLYLRKNEFDRVNVKFKYAIYFDNSDPASILQIDKWFSNDFFHKDKTLIIFKINQSVMASHISFLERKNYNFYAFRFMKHLDFIDLKYIFYVFNSPTNTILTKNHSIKHIWIAHGESDKLSSVNPMIRIYDHIFVAGDISIKRLENYNIINKCDIESRILKIGIPYFKNKKNKSLNNKFKILLAPTWEGIETSQEYSSLENGFVEDILDAIKDKYKDCEIYFMPHPSTGVKNTQYIEYVQAIVNKNKTNKNFYIIQNKDSFILKYIFDILDEKQYIYDTPEYSSYNLAITDISSIMADLIYNKTNYLVLVKRTILGEYKNDIKFFKKMMPLLSISTMLFDDEIQSFNQLSEKEILNNNETRYSELIGYHNSKMEEIETSKRLDYCISLIS